MVESQVRPAQRNTRKLRELRYDAGSLALDLVCTVGRRGARRVERLGSCQDLAEWLRRQALPLPSDAIDEEFLAAVHLLREALHDFLRALTDGERPPIAPIRLINARASIQAPTITIALDDTVPGTAVTARRESELGTDHVLALIAQDGIDHLADDDRRARLTVCAARDCQMLYLATSRNAPRQWCSMSRCGNRAKAANYRARQESSASGSPLTP